MATKIACVLLLVSSCSADAFDVAGDSCYRGSMSPICIINDDIDPLIVAAGVEAFADAYRREWSPDMIRFALRHTVVRYGEIYPDACGPHRGGCMLVGEPDEYVTAHVESRECFWRTGECRPINPWQTPLVHELVHAAEWFVDGMADAQHEHMPWRWAGELPQSASYLWQTLLIDRGLIECQH